MTDQPPSGPARIFGGLMAILVSLVLVGVALVLAVLIFWGLIVLLGWVFG